MNAALTETLPISETIAAESVEHLAETLRDASAGATAVYPVGGGSSLQFGLPAKREGIAVQLGKLNQIVDYPARDLTVTVQAGIPVAELQQRLAAEQQRLPIDVPDADQATLGGLIATNHSGPLRCGHGTLRDYVIGIRAVDGQGNQFAGGGRVVKNVAGYDFCKLLTGSLGTLGVITEITLKLKPTAAAEMWTQYQLEDLQQADRLLEKINASPVTPAAVELLTGPVVQQWELGDSPAVLLIKLEGTAQEVDWIRSHLSNEFAQVDISESSAWQGDSADAIAQKLTAFPADLAAPLIVQATGVPSATTRLIEAFQSINPNISIQSHAADGIVIAKFTEIPDEGFAPSLIRKIQPLAIASHGAATILSNPGGQEMTHQTVWGGCDLPLALMRRVKLALDPNEILNPGRFIY